MAAAKTKGFSRDMRKLEKYYKWKVNGKQTNLCLIMFLYREREPRFTFIHIYMTHDLYMYHLFHRRSIKDHHSYSINFITFGP